MTRNKTRKELARMFREYSRALKACNDELMATEEAKLRAQADFVNFRQTASKRERELHRYRAQPVVEDLVPFATSLRQSKRAMKGHPEILRGQELLEDQFESAIARHGASLIVPEEGAAFTPAEMEALATIESSNPDMDGTVAQVAEPGMRIGSRVVNAAKVLVYSAAKTAADDELIDRVQAEMELVGMSGLRRNPARRRKKKKRAPVGLLLWMGFIATTMAISIHKGMKWRP